ncbi:MAG: SDR family oxidoreductase [Desulfitobacterium hafniense]|nr:SDR family oxidoreductase [Desulfitobacterium hafniense]
MEIRELFGFNGKNVVITGAGSGMGYEAAKLLVQLGANVYATVRRKPLDFAVTKEIQVDLSSPKEMDAFIDKLPDEIESLFLCHGISNMPGNSNALEVQLVDFLGFKYLTEKLLPKISDNGSVTFISSNGARKWKESLSKCLGVIECQTWDDAVKWYNNHPDATKGGYIFAKECQNAYVKSKVHAPEFINRKIRLNVIAPGMTLTGLTDDFNKSINGDAEHGKEMMEKNFLSPWNGRWATPEEMGHPLVVVGSKLCSYLSGEIIYIDYGTTSAMEFEALQKSL